MFAPKKYIKIIRRSISHFKGDDDDTELEKRTILDKEQMNWLKEVEPMSSTTARVVRNILRESGTRLPSMARTPREKAMSVAMGIAAPSA